MLLIIFGAGASYDSSSDFLPGENRNEIENIRPPLAKDLFHNRNSFREILNKYERCKGIADQLRRAKSIEEELEKLLIQASTNPQRFCEITATQIYFTELLQMCSHEWLVVTKGVTNYRRLLNLTGHHCNKDQTLFVSFNYDVLLELSAMRELNIDDTYRVSDWGEEENNIFLKPHGCIYWSRVFRGISYDSPPNDTVSYLRFLIDNSPVIRDRVTNTFKQKSILSSRTGNDPLLYPALAIPYRQKTNFECPTQHIELLKILLPKVRRVLIIGWAAAEEHFKALLSEGLRANTELMIISDESVHGDETYNSLDKSSVKFRDPTILRGGFSRAFDNPKLEEFFPG